MRYVLDSSVAFKWVVPEQFSDKAQLLRHDFGNAVHDLFAPDVFAAELGHALTRAERQGRLSPGETLTLWTEVMTTAPTLFPSVPLMPRAISISSSVRMGSYDCLYVALAEKEKCEFVTADDKLVKNLQSQFPFIKHISTFP